MWFVSLLLCPGFRPAFGRSESSVSSTASRTARPPRDPSAADLNPSVCLCPIRSTYQMLISGRGSLVPQRVQRIQSRRAIQRSSSSQKGDCSEQARAEAMISGSVEDTL
jgi:hypothetical protein